MISCCDFFTLYLPFIYPLFTLCLPKRTNQQLEQFTPKTFYLLDDAPSAEMQAFEQYCLALSAAKAKAEAAAGAAQTQAIALALAPDAPVEHRAGTKNFWILKPAAGSNCGDGIR